LIIIVAALTALPRASQQLGELKASALERMEQSIWGAFLSLHAQQLESAKRPSTEKEKLRSASYVERACAESNKRNVHSPKNVVHDKLPSSRREAKEAKSAVENFSFDFLVGKHSADGVELAFDAQLDPQTWRKVAKKVEPALRHQLAWIEETIAQANMRQSPVESKPMRINVRLSKEATPEMKEDAQMFLTRIVGHHQRQKLKDERLLRFRTGETFINPTEQDELTAPVRVVKSKSQGKLSCARAPVAPTPATQVSPAKTTRA
jgi:hypothetical protein